MTTGAGLVEGQPVDRGDLGQAGLPGPLPAPGTAATGAAVSVAVWPVLTLAGVDGDDAVDLVALAQSVRADLAGRERKVGRGPPVPGRPQVAAPVGEIDDAGDQRDRSCRPGAVARGRYLRVAYGSRFRGNALLFFCCFFCDYCHGVSLHWKLECAQPK